MPEKFDFPCHCVFIPYPTPNHISPATLLVARPDESVRTGAGPPPLLARLNDARPAMPFGQGQACNIPL
jgi:hypothetical protein